MPPSKNKLTVDTKAIMIANLQLELEARKEKLQAQCEAQCASLQSRLKRRLNRLSPAQRQTLLVHLLETGHSSSKPPP